MIKIGQNMNRGLIKRLFGHFLGQNTPPKGGSTPPQRGVWGVQPRAPPWFGIFWGNFLIKFSIKIGLFDTVRQKKMAKNGQKWPKKNFLPSGDVKLTKNWPKIGHLAGISLSKIWLSVIIVCTEVRFSMSWFMVLFWRNEKHCA